jgi:predicted patatin/cPLA2 family phospholipase
MKYEGRQGVLTRLLLKRRLLAEGDERHKALRPMLMILSGVMRGVYGSGQILALDAFRLTDAFDTVVAASTGTPTGAYFLAGQASMGIDVFSEECASKEFIKLRRMHVDVDYLASVFRGERERRALDEDAVRASRTEFFAAITDAVTGEGVLANAKLVTPDMVQLIRASIGVPGMSGDPTLIAGRLYIDGAASLALPITKAVERFDPTDILVLANSPDADQSAFMRTLSSKAARRSYPPAVLEIFDTLQQRFDAELKFLRHGFKGGFGIIWSDHAIDPFTTDSAQLRLAGERARDHLHTLLAHASGPTSS